MESERQQTTPIVHDGVMYLASPGNIVHALDAATGELRWEYRRKFPTGRGRDRPNRSISIYRNKIFLNTAAVHLVALDARTAEVVWDVEAPIQARGIHLQQRLDCGACQGDLRDSLVITVLGQRLLHHGPSGPGTRAAAGRGTRWSSRPPTSSGRRASETPPQPTSRRTLDSGRPGHAPLRVHGQRSDDVDETMDGPDSHEKE